MTLIVSMRRLLFLASMPWLLFSWAGCTTIKTEHHIVLDHTLTIKLAAEVEDFLDDLYADEDDAVPDESSQPEKK
jgi:hypothetical protein